jgi:hypothetical protein
MKKIILLLLIGIIFLYPIFTGKKELISMNIEKLSMTDYTKKNISSAFFYFNELDETIRENEIREYFLYCDSVKILNIQSYSSLFDKSYIGSHSPLFSIDIVDYYYFAIIDNQTIAGSESISNRSIYLLTPIGWYFMEKRIYAMS